MTLPKTKKEIASHLEIDSSTLRRWLKNHKLQIPRGYIPPSLVNKIYKKLDYEGKLKDFERKERISSRILNREGELKRNRSMYLTR